MIATAGDGASPTIGATITPSTSQTTIVSTSTARLVRSRPTIVMKPAAPTRAATMNTPIGQCEPNPKIAPMILPPAHSRNGSTMLTATKHANMSSVESQGLANTGRSGVIAARRACPESAARSEVLSCDAIRKPSRRVMENSRGSARGPGAGEAEQPARDPAQLKLVGALGDAIAAMMAVDVLKGL